MLETNGTINSNNSITVIVSKEGNEVAISRTFSDTITKENVKDLSETIESIILDELFTKRIIKKRNEKDNTKQEGTRDTNPKKPSKEK